jgi:hypothetical protein
MKVWMIAVAIYLTLITFWLYNIEYRVRQMNEANIYMAKGGLILARDVEELLNNQRVIVNLLAGNNDRAGELLESFHDELSFDEDGYIVINEVQP